ncbi:myo-inositol 2-dehydrogenase-like [Diorhabda sublineata]|uniref:myo-inositol 2-dehydrogenase-like n=1 Tax=Diorhabda sublineata TaxID=1163346 RepID=UPI0024E07F38|nr:myo-inositol 2-dehydrogenase-like [Diorhabda sublineata]
MATNKYKLTSPYTRQSLDCPPEDEVYKTYLETTKFDSSTSEPFGVAIFGIGRAGSIHLINLAENRRVDILYIVDDDVNKLDKIKNYYKRSLDKTVFLQSKDQQQVFEDTGVDFIVCASPTFTHENIVKNALQNKKAIFCEKPISESIVQSKALFELSEKVQRILFSAFNRRFDDSYNTIKKKVMRGDIGRVLTVKVCSRDGCPPPLDYLKTSGGIFHDCAVHDIDQVISVLGEYPTKVSVFAEANIPEIAAIDDADTVNIIMSFESGTLAMIDLSRQCIFGYDQRLEVFGEKGMIKAENKSPMSNLEEYQPGVTKKSPIYYSFASRYQEAYRKEMDHFMNVLEGKEELIITKKDLLAVSKIAAACEKSWRTGQVVFLTWTEEELH